MPKYIVYEGTYLTDELAAMLYDTPYLAEAKRKADIWTAVVVKYEDEDSDLTNGEVVYIP